MKKQTNPVIDKEHYKHYLMDEIEALKKDNLNLKQKLNDLQMKYDKIIKVQETEDCYTCVCGAVTQCNCKHLGYLKQALNRSDWRIPKIEQLNTMWDIEDIHKT